MPEDIEPGSIEARLWEISENQRQLRTELETTRREQAQRTALETRQQVAQRAGSAAGQQFGSRYPGLSPEDVVAIARNAGQSGVAAGMVSAMSAGREPTEQQMVAAYDRALEHVLWTDPAMRAKVLGAAPPQERGMSPPSASGNAQTTTPPAPAADDRKRKLTALSAASNPVSSSPQRPPVSITPDGRLTGDSRTNLIKELATGIARSTGGEF